MMEQTDFLMNFRRLAVATVLQEDYIQTGEPAVYIMGFSNGVVKVGQSSDVGTRHNAHRSNRLVRGHYVSSNWWMRSKQALLDERFLKKAAKALGGSLVGRSTEWFTDVDADLLIAVANEVLTPAEKPPLSYYFPHWTLEDFPEEYLTEAAA